MDRQLRQLYRISEKKPEKKLVAFPETRCPYCHENVISGQDEQQGCSKCRAWHHKVCWQEHGGCSTCGHRELPLSKGKTPGILIVTQGDFKYGRNPEIWPIETETTHQNAKKYRTAKKFY